jgi:hypothetical protein
MAETFVWKGNSKVMFDKILDMNPWFVRPLSRRSMVRELNEMCCKDADSKKEVTESMMYEVVQKVTPEQYKDKAIKALNELKTG